MTTQDLNSYPGYAKLLHLGLALFGTAAYLTSELAEDGTATTGYLLHAYLGLSLAAFMAVRLLAGVTTSPTLSFRHWSPFSRAQLGMAMEDFRTLLTFKTPHRDRHQGLAGLTQAFGLMLFAWMGASGTGLFFLGGGYESDLYEVVEELHEVGESLIPLYLLLHIGAVILHTLGGNPIWKRMFSMKES